MLESTSPLTLLREALAAGRTDPASVVDEVLACANGNASRNTYAWFDRDFLLRQAEELKQTGALSPLWSVPISLKDCFDLAGAPTGCGTLFYAQRGPAAQDSAMAERLRAAGALITGKAHLHPLAYGITGENPEYGDCLQPRDSTLLTGGSSSGAAASVQEGSALAAIGTDTGGSIRVPAALCGLVGYRASYGLIADWPQSWAGAEHLAPSFDTLGFLLRDPRDAAQLANTLFGVAPGVAPVAPRIGCVPDSFLADCEADVLAAYEAWKQELSVHGAQIASFDQGEWQANGWDDTTEIFAGIQAHEASQLHAGNYDRFEPAIRDRLLWGASLTTAELDMLGARLASFRASVRGLMASYDLLMLPSAPVSRLAAGADHSSARARILRYTTPYSLAGLPAITLPGEILGAPLGTGVQLAAAPGADAMLLAYARAIGQAIASRP